MKKTEAEEGGHRMLCGIRCNGRALSREEGRCFDTCFSHWCRKRRGQRMDAVLQGLKLVSTAFKALTHCQPYIPPSSTPP